MLLQKIIESSSSTILFDTYDYPLDNGPSKLAKIPSDANNMTISEARKAQKMYEMSGNVKESRKMKVRIYEKMTLPMSCIVFSLIGSTLGIKQNIRSSKSQGFGSNRKCTELNDNSAALRRVR